MIDSKQHREGKDKKRGRIVDGRVNFRIGTGGMKGVVEKENI
jgi:hypothetical protein